MTTLETKWVSRAPEAQPCQRCGTTSYVFALKLIFDVPRYLCHDCLVDATVVSTGVVVAQRQAHKKAALEMLTK